jgi:Lrp/AsnC family transcriptional regulator, regulator for asnA, asnC and gidA
VEVSIDRVDEGILRELQADGRASYRQIARTVGVSEGTVRARVRRLEGAGALRVLAFVDPSRLGRSVLALVLLRVDAAEQERVIETIAGWDEVSYVSSLVGRVDVYIQVICPDNAALWDVVSRARAVPGVRQTETMLEMAVHKFAYRDFAGFRPAST